MVQQLESVEEVVDALDGNPGVMALTGAKYSSTVSNWKKDGIFPGKVHKVMKEALALRSLSAPDRLWRIIHG